MEQYITRNCSYPDQDIANIRQVKILDMRYNNNNMWSLSEPVSLSTQSLRQIRFIRPF